MAYIYIYIYIYIFTVKYNLIFCFHNHIWFNCHRLVLILLFFIWYNKLLIYILQCILINILKLYLQK
jgi:hypothetical protein